jgi:hypothetical protein
MRPGLQGAPKYNREAYRKSYPYTEAHGPHPCSCFSRWPNVMRHARGSIHVPEWDLSAKIGTVES